MSRLAKRTRPLHGPYALTQEDRRTVGWLGSASPFNITAEATSLGPFTEPEVTELLSQHTAATGQRFEPEAAAKIYALSQGHPWLVNAMADQIVDRDLRDRSVSVTAAHVEAAKEAIILDRRTHIDSLIHKLRDPRVRMVNGGGRVEREYGLGRGALDIVIEWRGARHLIEVKLRRDTQTEERAIEQVTGYLDRAGLSEGWLLMFNLRSKLPWGERLYSRAVESEGKRVFLVGC